MGSKYTQLEKLSRVCGSDLSIVLLYLLKTGGNLHGKKLNLSGRKKVNFVQIKNAVSSTPGNFFV